jgi:hypothetical protein
MERETARHARGHRLPRSCEAASPAYPHPSRPGFSRSRSSAPAQSHTPQRSVPNRLPSPIITSPLLVLRHSAPVTHPPSLGARRLTASVTKRTLSVNAKAQSHALLFHSFIFTGPPHMTETLQIQHLDAFHRRMAIHRQSHLTHCMSAYRGQSHISFAGVSSKMSRTHIE